MTASGVISKPLQGLADLLASLAAFQTWTGAADAAAAAAFIDVVVQACDEALSAAETDYKDSKPERAALRPRAVVAWAGDATGAADQDGGHYHAHELRLQLTLEAVAGAGLSEADALMTFLNAVGEIYEDLWEAQATPGNLAIHEITMTSPPARMHPADVAAGELDLLTMTFEVLAAER